jgi:hypothetical protein
MFRSLPSPGELHQLKHLIDNYYEAMNEIAGYIFDLRVEAQNNLLSNLFQNRVPQRKPLDPKHKVISTDAEVAEQLIRYFEKETAWGANVAAIEAEARAASAEKEINP